MSEENKSIGGVYTLVLFSAEDRKKIESFSRKWGVSLSDVVRLGVRDMFTRIDNGEFKIQSIGSFGGKQ